MSGLPTLQKILTEYGGLPFRNTLSQSSISQDEETWLKTEAVLSVTLHRTIQRTEDIEAGGNVLVTMMAGRARFSRLMNEWYARGTVFDYPDRVRCLLNRSQSVPHVQLSNVSVEDFIVFSSDTDVDGGVLLRLPSALETNIPVKYLGGALTYSCHHIKDHNVVSCIICKSVALSFGMYDLCNTFLIYCNF